MKPLLQLFTPRSSSSICCPVGGFGIVRAQPDLIAGLRRNPVPPPGSPLSPAFLKHADDQTVAGIAAVFQAIHNHHLTEVNFSGWGVVASPYFLGRVALANTIQRYAMEGPWGISPHVIPHHSVHAISGTISQALKIHGPNFGIGGGPGGVAEAVMVAATLMATRKLPGLWLVLTAFEPDLIPLDPRSTAGNGHAGAVSSCLALALALVPHASASIGLALQVCLRDDELDHDQHDGSNWPPLASAAALLTAFSQDGTPEGKWRLGSTGWLELESRGPGPENQR